MRKIEKLNSKSPKNKFLKCLYGRLVYYQTFQIYCKQYDTVRESEINKLVDYASEHLSEQEMRDLLKNLGFPAINESKMNLSEEALYLVLN